MLKNTKDNFGFIAKCLHWVIGLLIIGLIALGAYMVTLGYYDAWYHDSLSYHKALGMVVLGLVVAKIAWMIKNTKPDDLSSWTALEKKASFAVHKILLLIMVLMPLTGYLVSTSAGEGISIFGLFEIPALIKIDEQGRDLSIAIHYYLAYGGAVIILIHALAALKHHFINKDKTLRRML